MKLIEKIILGGMFAVAAYGLGVMKAGEYYMKPLINCKDSLVVEREIIEERMYNIFHSDTTTENGDYPKIRRKLKEDRAKIDSQINIVNNELNASGKNLRRALKSWAYQFE